MKMYPYGTALSLNDEELYEELFALAEEVMEIVKEIVEE